MCELSVSSNYQRSSIISYVEEDLDGRCSTVEGHESKEQPDGSGRKACERLQHHLRRPLLPVWVREEEQPPWKHLQPANCLIKRSFISLLLLLRLLRASRCFSFSHFQPGGPESLLKALNYALLEKNRVFLMSVDILESSFLQRQQRRRCQMFTLPRAHHWQQHTVRVAGNRMPCVRVRVCACGSSRGDVKPGPNSFQRGAESESSAGDTRGGNGSRLV